MYVSSPIEFNGITHIDGVQVLWEELERFVRVDRQKINTTKPEINTKDRTDLIIPPALFHYCENIFWFHPLQEIQEMYLHCVVLLCKSIFPTAQLVAHINYIINMYSNICKRKYPK